MENTNNKDQKISTPMAIIVAGVLVMIGILVSKGGVVTKAPKTISEQVGVSKDKLLACIKETDLDSLNNSINDSVDRAMKNVTDRGTPYAVIIGKGGIKTEVQGAQSYSIVKKEVDDAKLGKVNKAYTGDLPEVTESDHIYGNKDAEVTIVEYSDYECPFCKQFSPTLKKIVDESNGTVRWVYRHYPLHQHSFEKLVAAECVAKLKGNDAFWQYGDLLFGLLDPKPDSISEQL
jgi:hypothetical protein